MKTFAITGMGRSGTQFLSGILNSVVGWKVEHEPYSGFQDRKTIQARFDYQEINSINSQIGYGEVNSYLRNEIAMLDVGYRAIIIRDPIEIFQSMFNRGKPKLNHLDNSLRSLHNSILLGVPTISFRAMTSDLTYLKTIALGAGVKLPGWVSLRSRNVSTFQKIPLQLQRKAANRLQWFSNIYGRMW